MTSPSAPSHASARRALVSGLAVTQMVGWGSTLYSFAVFVDPLEAALGASRAQTSLAFSLMLLVQGLVAFAVGRLIDAGRERVVMSGGSLLMGLGLIAQGLAPSLGWFYAAWALIGLGMSAALYGPAFAVVTRRFPADFRRAIITVSFLGGLSITVFVPLSAWLIEHWGWRAASCTLGALHLALCLPLHAWLLRAAPPAPAAVPVSAPPAPSASSVPRAAHQHGASLSSHLRGPVFWRLGLAAVLVGAVTSAVPPHLVSLMRESGLSNDWAIAVPASIGVLQVLGRLLLYAGERWVNVHTINLLAPLLIALSVLALLLGRGHVPAALLFALFYGVGNGTLTIVMGTVMAQYVSAAHVGALNGVLGLPQALVCSAAPLVVGLLWMPTRGYTLGLLLLLTLALLGVAMLRSAQRRALNVQP